MDEHALVKAIQAGDTRAIESLYTLYFDRLYARVFHGVKRDKAATEDIVQNVFLSALKSARDFKGQSKLYTWLVGIANHKIMDYYRRTKREVRLDVNSKNDEIRGFQPPVDDAPSVQESLESAEMQLVVEKALSSLPIDYRQVLLLKYVEDMKVFEISQVMGRSPKSIDGLLTRARKLLKEALTENSRGKTPPSGD
jgi:RNA polymerase sigma-70 factor (ECF subfamily)